MELVLPPGDFAGYIFDCDGTLADTMPLHYRAWDATLRRHGFDGFTEDIFYSYGGVPTDRIVALLNERFGLSLPIEGIFDEKEELFRGLSVGVRPIKAVAAIAREARAEKRLAVASGGPRVVVEETLARIGFAGFFDAVVTADDVVHGKPAPDIFLEAARRIGVEPGKCLVFEDASPGIRAAAAAGMACVVVPSRDRSWSLPPRG